jgi:hypothetical protein
MNNKAFDSGELLEILAYLDFVLGREGLRLELAVYGGSAILLYFGEESRHITEDLDGVIKNRHEFGRHPAIFKEVGERYGLAEDWINSNIMNTLAELKREDLVEFGAFENLVVRLPTKEQLLAMKIKAARYFPKNDFADAQQIVSDLGITSLDDVHALVEKYLPQFLITDEVERFMYALMKEGEHEAIQ